jgi:hypothetical protein
LIYLPIGAIGAYSRILRTIPDFTAPITMSFGDDGIVVQSSTQRSEMSWTAFSGWAETQDYYLLSYGGMAMETVLPKRAFTQQQAEAFITYLKHIGAEPRSGTIGDARGK